MSLIDELNNAVKTQQGRRYRFVRMDSENVSSKIARGYSFLKKDDPEIKGTILERHVGAENMIRVGDLALAKISERDAKRHEEKIREKTDRKLRAIKRSYQASGEDVKRKLGKHHGDFKVIHNTSDED